MNFKKLIAHTICSPIYFGAAVLWVVMALILIPIAIIIWAAETAELNKRFEEWF